MAEPVTEQELRALSDEELVKLLMERSNLTERDAFEALAALRGGTPPGVRL